MLGNRAVLMATVLLMLAFCLTTTALAQSTCSTCPAGNTGTCSTCPAGIQGTYAPTGAGPAEVVQGLSVAPIGVILQRGYVTNVAEAHAVAMAAIQLNGGMCTVGDYKVAYYLSAPQGFYKMKHGKLVWNTPSSKDTQHISVIVMDSLTGMPIPVNKLKVDVLDQCGKEVQSRTLNYEYTCLGASYGSNLSVCAGSYSFRVYAPAPSFNRGDRTCGNRLNCPIDAQFACARINPLPCAPVGAGPCNPCGTVAPANPCNTCPPVAPPSNICPPPANPCGTCPQY